MSIQHSDPEIQNLILTLEFQRDQAVAACAAQAKRAADLEAALMAAAQNQAESASRIAELEAKLSATESSVGGLIT